MELFFNNSKSIYLSRYLVVELKNNSNNKKKNHKIRTWIHAEVGIDFGS